MRSLLYEASRRLGGQALLAQLLPRRAEFGGIVTNLAREMELAGVAVRLAAPVDPRAARCRTARRRDPRDRRAAAASPPEAGIEGGEHMRDAWQVIRDEVTVGSSVAIADWRCDWIGLGLAEKLARAGSRVRLCVGRHRRRPQHPPVRARSLDRPSCTSSGSRSCPTRGCSAGMARPAYFQHACSGESIVFEGIDTVIALPRPSPRCPISRRSSKARRARFT